MTEGRTKLVGNVAFLLAGILILLGTVWEILPAQVQPQITGSGAPTGSCTSTQQYLDTTNHVLYYCNSNAWSASQGLGNLTGSQLGSPGAIGSITPATSLAIQPTADATSGIFTVKNAAGTTTYIQVDTTSGGNGLVLSEAGGGFALLVNTNIVGLLGGARIGGSIQMGATNNLLISNTPPTIAAAGCGGGAASIVVSNGTGAFKINVGTTPGSACTITMPAAATGWNVTCNDITTQSTSVFVQKQTAAESTTSVTITNFNDVAAATAFVASDILKCTAAAD